MWVINSAVLPYAWQPPPPLPRARDVHVCVLGRRQTALSGTGRAPAGHHLRWRGEKASGGEDANSPSRSELRQEDRRLQPLFLGLLMAAAGSPEEDVYFSAVPSQKSTLSALATITEQLLWLGGPGAPLASPRRLQPA